MALFDFGGYLAHKMAKTCKILQKVAKMSFVWLKTAIFGNKIKNGQADLDRAFQDLSFEVLHAYVSIVTFMRF